MLYDRRNQWLCFSPFCLFFIVLRTVKIPPCRQQWEWGGKKMIHKRIIRTGVIVIIGISIILIRLAQIQLFDTKSFSHRNIDLIHESVKQRSQEVIIDNGRGKFYDRNMVPLTHEAIPTLVLFPFLNHMDWDIEKLAKIINVPAVEIKKVLQEAKGPVVFGEPNPLVLTPEQMEAINHLEIPGVFAVEKQFDRKITPAAQLIGILGENPEELKKRYPDREIPINTMIGISGLQKSFDEFLIQEESTKLIYHVDGRGSPLFGIDVKFVDQSNPFYPVKVQTTIDYEIQKKAEQIVDQYQIMKGGLILLDIESNSILASVSRPSLDISHPYANNGIKDMMLTAHTPGSVFKTVIAAASIDHQLAPPDRTFNCSVTIHGDIDEQYDHGILNFKDSFAASCNNTFATLAKELAEKDETIIETYAHMLGLNELTGWVGNVYHIENFKQLADEEKGYIYLEDEERKDLKLNAQTGIGQQSVRITPLAAANMMATIARGGEKKMVRAVESIQYKNGTELYRFPKKSLEGDHISSYTASKLQQLLREVVVNEKGTGKSLNDLPYPVAGKSGTAETYRQDKQGNELLNRWFVGYFPYEKPKYAMAVVNLDVIEGEGSVIPLFKDMVNFLFEFDQQRTE
jgi:penicillin-binding protein 4B